MAAVAGWSVLARVVDCEPDTLTHMPWIRNLWYLGPLILILAVLTRPKGAPFSGGRMLVVLLASLSTLVIVIGVAAGFIFEL